MTLQPGKLILAKDYPADDDARAYVAAVEAADEADTPGIGALEPAVVAAYDNFIVGCKADGIWDAIKASCILAGAKTLEGSFIDLKSATKILTNNNFADGTYVGSNYTTGDYNRKTGLVGDGSTNYLSTARNNNNDPQDNKHLSVYVTEGSSGPGEVYIAVDGGSSGASMIARNGAVRLNAATFGTVDNPSIPNGLFGVSRSSSASFTSRYNGSDKNYNITSETPSNRVLTVFAMDNLGSLIAFTQDRIAFYSIGEALDLALLDARISTLISDLGAAIP